MTSAAEWRETALELNARLTRVRRLTPRKIARAIDSAWGNDGGNKYAHQNLARAVSKLLRETIEPRKKRPA